MKKTLILFGSARKKGHTMSMVKLLTEQLAGKSEVELIDCYRLKNISPCMDCRRCWEVKECAIHDDMDDIYKKLEEADSIIMAAPSYFHSVPAPMKLVLDRCQVYWAKAVRRDMTDQKQRTGAILLTGGAPAFPEQFVSEIAPLKCLLDDLNTQCLDIITISDSDHKTLSDYPDAMERIRTLAETL